MWPCGYCIGSENPRPNQIYVVEAMPMECTGVYIPHSWARFLRLE